MSAIQKARLDALTALGRYPKLFHSIASIGSNRSTLVRPTTGLCIEAPPRSGNSFFVTGFSMANPTVQLAHHHHVPAQVLRAISLQVPVVVLLRNPVDSSLAKAAPGMEPFLIGTTLARWISFWQVVKDSLTSTVAVPFEYLISNPAGVISRLNGAFGTFFSVSFPESRLVFEEMERGRLAKLGRISAEKPNPNIPSSQIAAKEELLRSYAHKHSRAKAAMGLYRELSARLAPLWVLPEEPSKGNSLS